MHFRALVPQMCFCTSHTLTLQIDLNYFKQRQHEPHCKKKKQKICSHDNCRSHSAERCFILEITFCLLIAYAVTKVVVIILKAHVTNLLALIFQCKC